MSKKFIQSKLDFSQSRPKYEIDKVKNPHLKRKSSDRFAETDLGDSEKKAKMSLSYADATQGKGSTSGQNNKSSSSHTKGYHTHKINDNRPVKDGAEGSTSSGRSFSSGGNRSILSTSSQSRFDSHGSTSTLSDFHKFDTQTSDTEPYQIHKPPKNYYEGTDHGHIQKKIEKDKPKTLLEGNHMWQGVSLHELKRAPECFKQKGLSLPPLKASRDHKVFFDTQLEGWSNELPTPYKDGRQDVWDESHVHMPYSRYNIFTTENEDICHRWEKIENALKRRITNSFELEVAILSYNPHYRSRWNFEALHQYFDENEGVKDMKNDFFVKILPSMQDLALRLPELCPKAIPILKQRADMKVTLSQQQVACLLANAFFCTFPRRNFKVKNGQLPDINFSNLFSDSHSSRKFEKFKCIINYFQRVTENMPTGTVTYSRQWLQAQPYWNKMDKKFTNLHVSTSGTIEDDGRGMLQADFANKYVGGGVLGHGLVQEEIRFLICPEMILSRLFTEVLTDCEVLIMTGCERFSNYEGYSESFMFSGNHEDDTERDEWGRRCTEVVAMDALVIRGGYNSQFETDKLFRELNKAYCAFKGNYAFKGNQFNSSLPAVCTGNWGCGAFGGDKQLKALIQMMAASAVDRDVCYFTFGDSTFCQQLGEFYSVLKDNDLTIHNVLDMIKYYKHSLNNTTGPETSLFQYIASCMGSSSVDSPASNQEIDYPSTNDDFSMDTEKCISDEDYKASTP